MLYRVVDMVVEPGPSVKKGVKMVDMSIHDVLMMCLWCCWVVSGMRETRILVVPFILLQDLTVQI